MDASNNVTTNSSITTKGVFMTTYAKMDDLNKKAVRILLTSGSEAAVKHMFTGSKGEKLTYLEMRERYG